MTGPNTTPTFAVPCFWNRKRTNRMISVAGTTKCSIDGAPTLSPSIAPSTEIAGVMIPSPYNNAAPNKPSTV